MKGFLAALKQHYATIPVRRRNCPTSHSSLKLWADQFQHLTTLALAGGGGLLVLLQTGTVQANRNFWVALVLFALVATLSVVGQTSVVDDATQGNPPGRQTRMMRGLAMVVFGAAAMAAIDVLT